MPAVQRGSKSELFVVDHIAFERFERRPRMPFVKTVGLKVIVKAESGGL